MLAEYPSQGNLKGINKPTMKAKTIEELRKEYLKGDFKNYRRFLEQKLIQPEPQRVLTDEMIKDMCEGLTEQDYVNGLLDARLFYESTQHFLHIVSEQVTEGIEGSVLINRLNDSSFEELLKYLNVNYEIVKKEPFCDTEFKISIQDLDSAIWIGRRFQMKLQGEELESLQNKEEAINFAEWIIKNEYEFFDNTSEGNIYISDEKPNKQFTMDELYQLFISK